MSSSAYVFEGLWIDHSHNIFLGATITLKDRDAAFLLALLALVVAAAGRSFWTIFSYIAHQSRCTDNPQDAQFYQQQAILKNSASPLGAAWKFARLLAGESMKDLEGLPP
jgi:NhaP-type Na+/H+ or K+/H+ antiporter